MEKEHETEEQHTEGMKECACGKGGCEDGSCGACDDDCACEHESMPKTKIPVREGPAPETAVDGAVLRVHYTGKLDDGETFDTSVGKEPIEFVMGDHNVIKGFEDGVRGLRVGEKRSITIEPKDAYGDVNPELRQEVPKEALGDIEPEVGMMLALQHPMAEQPIPVKIVEVSPTAVTIDLNHPLAGQRLHFDLEVVEIK